MRNLIEEYSGMIFEALIYIAILFKCVSILVYAIAR